MMLSNILKIELKNISAYTSVTFLTSLGSFLLIPLFWSRLTPGDYGIIAVSEILSGFLAGTLGLSLDNGITRFYYEWSKEDRKTNTGTIWILSWISNITLGLITILIFSKLTKYIFEGIDFSPYIFFGILIIILRNFALIPFSLIRIMKKVKMYVFFKLFVFLTTMIALILFILVFDLGINGYFYAVILTGIIQLIMYTIIMLKLSRVCFKPEKVIDTIVFSINYIPSAILNGASSKVDMYILQRYSDLNILGIYSIGLQFANLIAKLNQALKLSWGPFMYELVLNKKEIGKNIAAKMSAYYILILFIGCISVSLFVDDFVLFTENVKYLPIVDIVPYLVFIIFLGSLNVYVAPGIVMSKKTKLLIYPNIAYFIIILGFGFLLISNYQINGIIFSRFLGQLTFLISSIYLSKKLYYWNSQLKLVGLLSLLYFMIIHSRKMILIQDLYVNILIDIGGITFALIISLLVIKQINSSKNKSILEHE